MAGAVHAVEDDAAHRLILEHVLPNVAPGVPIRIHGGVEEAARAVARDRADGIAVFLLSDLHLADGTAADLAERLEARRDKGIYLVVLSSTAPGDLAERLEDAGIDAFLEKPLDLEELSDRLEAALDSWLAAKAS